MSTGPHPERHTSLDGPLAEAPVGSRRFFSRARVSDAGRALYRIGGRAADAFYRDRWS
ncbi:hypothetical protein [Streptomyces chrestomyceticus]|uniref:hypothetical protein n=1 Tax=Streptomyces chrestomyceticus TaxID=68185 RepID=UPI000A971F70